MAGLDAARIWQLSAAARAEHSRSERISSQDDRNVIRFRLNRRNIDIDTDETRADGRPSDSARKSPAPDQEYCATEKGRDGALRDRQIERRRPQIADTRIISGFRIYAVRDAREDEL